MERDQQGIELALGLENSLDQLRRLVGSNFAFYAAHGLQIMDSLLPTPPAVCYNSQDNLYYLRYRGSFAGTLDPNLDGSEQDIYKGILQNRDADIWMPISAEKWLYIVANKTELDKLKVVPPAIAFRKDNHRYYYRVGPEGYGGRTGAKQLLDEQGQPVWDSGPAITGTVIVPGPNTWNTLYTMITDWRVVPGIQFTVEGIINPNTLQIIKFQITQIVVAGSKRMWGYLPEYDSALMLSRKITTTVATVPPVTGTVVAPDPPPTTDECYVASLSGIVLVGHEFRVNAAPTKYTILAIDGDKWTYENEGPQFPNGSTITMAQAGNPVMEKRDPDAWILNSHLYEDNTQGFI
jgi:hypothetical protein